MTVSGTWLSNVIELFFFLVLSNYYVFTYVSFHLFNLLLESENCGHMEDKHDEQMNIVDDYDSFGGII